MRREDDKLLVCFLAYTGLRIGEVFALRRSDIDPTRRTITVRESVGEFGGHLVVGPTKTYAVRTIPLGKLLGGEVAQRLATLPQGASTLLFGNGVGEHRRYRVCGETAGTRQRRGQGSKRHPTTFGPLAASLLIDAGGSVKDVQHHLGHASELTTLRLYARVRPGTSADLAERMDRLIQEGQA